MATESAKLINVLSPYLKREELEAREVLFHEACNPSYRQGAHCMYYARFYKKWMDMYEMPYAIAMQLRFDGSFGFIGGFIDPEEGVLRALNREIKEETGVNADEEAYRISENDYVVSHIHNNQLALHFYAKRLSIQKLVQLEMSCVRSANHGLEVMGMVRVPMFTVYDGYGGFPAFLQNQFIGNERFLLLLASIKAKLFTVEDVLQALEAVPPVPRRNKELELKRSKKQRKKDGDSKM